MNRVSPFGRRFSDERVLDAGTVAAEALVRPLSPEVALAAFTLLTCEPILFEEWDGEFFLVNLH